MEKFKNLFIFGQFFILSKVFFIFMASKQTGEFFFDRKEENQRQKVGVCVLCGWCESCVWKIQRETCLPHRSRVCVCLVPHSTLPNLSVILNTYESCVILELFTYCQFFYPFFFLYQHLIFPFLSQI